MKFFSFTACFVVLLLQSALAFEEKDLPINKTPSAVVAYIVCYSIFAILVLGINVWSYATYSNTHQLKISKSIRFSCTQPHARLSGLACQTPFSSAVDCSTVRTWYLIRLRRFDTHSTICINLSCDWFFFFFYNAEQSQNPQQGQSNSAQPQPNVVWWLRCRCWPWLLKSPPKGLSC